jgi:GT2 family glycosyltransferase
MTSEAPEPKVSVVIVSYNTRDLLRRAVASVLDAHEVVVVDNASADGSAEMIHSEFPGVELIANLENVGFGPANNQGIKAATGSIVLLMNSDAEAESGAVADLAAVFEDPHVVAAGGRLLHPDGRLQESAAGNLTLWAVFCEQTYLEKLFRRSHLFSPYWLSERLLAHELSLDAIDGNDSRRHGVSRVHRETQLDACESPGRNDHPHLTSTIKGDGLGPFPVAQVMGACLMMRPVELFDERFFLYCEDTELCRRLARRGKILYVPSARFVHTLGASSQTRWEAVARYNRGKELFFRIHSGRTASCLCFGLDRLGALLRLIGWSVASPIVGSSGRNKAVLFWRVLTAPVSGPRRPPRNAQ